MQSRRMTTNQSASWRYNENLTDWLLWIVPKVTIISLLLMLTLLSGCGTKQCVVVDSPTLSLPEQYKRDYPPLPSSQELAGDVKTWNGDSLSVLIKTATGAYNECRASHNTLWRACERLLDDGL